MPETSPVERIRRIQSLLLEAPRSGSVIAVRAELEILEQEYLTEIRSIEQYRQHIEQLQKDMRELRQQALQHALVLGPSPRRDDTYVVSVGGTRYDVGLAPVGEAGGELPAPRAGQEVLVRRDNYVICAVAGEVRNGEIVQVVDVIRDPGGKEADRLLVRWGGGDGVVIDLARRLLELPATAGDHEPRRPRAGDMVLVDIGARMAFETLKPRQTSQLELKHNPKGSYEDIAGLEGKIDVIRDAIELPYLRRERYERYRLPRPTGILLYGPPGCGKTMIGRAVANGLKTRIEEQLGLLIEALELYPQLAAGEAPDAAALAKIQRISPAAAAPDLTAGERAAVLGETLRKDFPPDLSLDLEQPQRSIERLRQTAAGVRSSFLNIKGPELLSKWVGEAEGRIRQIFSEARSYATYTTPVVVFFDEIESMFQRRGSGISTDLEKTMVPALLTELDGIEELSNVVLIGASNRHENLDPALMRPGRLDIKIKIDRPDHAATVAIFQKYLLPDLPLSDEGLMGVSVESFEGEVLRVIEGLGAAGGYLGLGSPAADFRCRPLRDLPPELQSAAAKRVREECADLGTTGRRLPAADLAAAIEEVCQPHADRLFGPGSLPRDRSLRVVLDLRQAEAALSDLPPVPPIFAELPAARAATPEEICRRLIETTADLLFSSQSFLAARVLAPCGSEQIFQLREFVSGALIENLVTRAKRLAIKRESLPQQPSFQAGVSLADLAASLRDEFAENKDQFILNRPELADRVCDTCKRRHVSADEYSIELRLGYSAHDRWRQPRRPPFEQRRDRRPFPAGQGVGT